MGLLERLGYVKEDLYEEVVKERDLLRATISRLRDEIKIYEKRRQDIEDRVEHMKRAMELLEEADAPKETVLAMVKRGIDFLYRTLKGNGDG
ncbi:hypothetical protein KEJ19_01310 [Candidatus Bathyarchaeota archaeon]|nr:hypothetical protein [Candidatus Bathyarchaeota archaeon]